MSRSFTDTTDVESTNKIEVSLVKDGNVEHIIPAEITVEIPSVSDSRESSFINQIKRIKTQIFNASEQGYFSAKCNVSDYQFKQLEQYLVKRGYGVREFRRGAIEISWD
jgi:hypothetical protein